MSFLICILIIFNQIGLCTISEFIYTVNVLLCKQIGLNHALKILKNYVLGFLLMYLSKYRFKTDGVKKHKNNTAESPRCFIIYLGPKGSMQ